MTILFNHHVRPSCSSLRIFSHFFGNRAQVALVVNPSPTYLLREARHDLGGHGVDKVLRAVAQVAVVEAEHVEAACRERERERELKGIEGIAYYCIFILLFSAGFLKHSQGYSVAEKDKKMTYEIIK